MLQTLLITAFALGATMTTKPYGSWESHLTAKDLTKGALRLGAPEVDGDTIYWTEGRPDEKGRNALMSWKNGETKELVSKKFNVRTTVHEYGGGSFSIKDGELFFSNFADQKLYHLSGDEVEITADRENGRYANCAIHPNKKWIYAVYEEHGEAVENAIALIDIKKKSTQFANRGHDFYSTPIISPDGKKLAYITWDVPDMPWDSSILWVCDILEDGSLGKPVQIAGGNEEAIIDPKWSPDNALYYCGDKTGFWNIYKYNGESRNICPMKAEFGFPHWVFGISRYGFVGNKIAAVYTIEGIDHLGLIDLETNQIEKIDLPFTTYGTLRIFGDSLVIKASDPVTPDAFYIYNPQSQELTKIRTSSEPPKKKSAISLPETIVFPTTGGKQAYAFYYPPQNPRFKGPGGELPPLIVQSHGGPTAHTTTGYSGKVQYWTSRGFGFADVNYGGSTGYGREYRNRLRKQWGVVDIDDCVNAALYLAKTGRVDRDKLAIRGGSAGGYTTLAALTFRDTFKAGASYYGVSDIEALAQDSHKFESHYDISLVGPLPEARATWKERSPIHHTKNISCPMIIFQGDEDKIVPPNQAEMMVEALKRNGLPVAYLLFKGEQHGFRKAENIIRSHEAELYFYSKIFGFPLAESIEPVDIVGLSN